MSIIRTVNGHILKTFDDTIHKEDEYETPRNIYEDLIKKYGIIPKLDVCATKENTKCNFFITKEESALEVLWPMDAWCNPPHSKTEAFVKKANNEHVIGNINIMMIVPANAICAHFFDLVFNTNPMVEYYRIPGRIRFLQHGKPAPNSSRNGYFVVLWRKRNGWN